MSRVALADIPALIFYDGSEARSRRGKPVPQLTCRGKACSSYKPDVVRCTNLGGAGTNVDWKASSKRWLYLQTILISDYRACSARLIFLSLCG
jgi:hypothetical protein